MPSECLSVFQPRDPVPEPEPQSTVVRCCFVLLVFHAVCQGLDIDHELRLRAGLGPAPKYASASLLQSVLGRERATTERGAAGYAKIGQR